MKLQNVPILPRCDSDNDDDSTDTSDVVSYQAGVAARGWSTDTYMELKVKDISFVPCNTFDDFLSEDDDSDGQTGEWITVHDNKW